MTKPQRVRLLLIVGLTILVLIIVAPLLYKLWRGNQIAFIVMNDEGRIAGLYKMNLLGGQPKLINSNYPAQPAWSPDGQKIAYVSSANAQGDAPYHISVMGSDGTNVQQLTNGQTRDYSPTWSPDGKQIAFVSTRDNSAGRLAIFTMNSDGSEIRRITPNAYYQYLSWSPDGTSLAFLSQTIYQFNIYTMNIDGSQLNRLTNVRNDNSLAWSPDRKYIAFDSYRDDPNQLDIYIMQRDGTDIRRLTHNPANDRFSSWSPDGKEILFASNRDSDDWIDHVYIMNADGTEQRRLTELNSNSPIWRP